MTPEQRVVHLEAELAEARADLRRVNETLRVMCETQARERAAEAERKAVRSARNLRARARASTETSHETRGETSPVLPPPLDGSPPLPAPISPSPLSSPPSRFSAVADAPPAAALELVPVEPPKRKPGKSNALGEFIDWFRAETRKQLAPDAPDNCRMEPHQAARLGEAVKLHGLETCKAAVGLWMGWEGSRTAGYPLGMFAAKWEGWVGRVRAPGSTSQRAETSAGRGAEGQDCAGCGKGGEGGRVGAVFLGYDCGCARAWHGAGLPYTDAEEWARNRRAGRAA